METRKSSWLPTGLHQYVVDRSRPPDAVLVEVAEVTVGELGERARMQIAPEQGAFLGHRRPLLAHVAAAGPSATLPSATRRPTSCVA
jgi:hypothetical protein